jgi:hypothetical protein
MTPRLFGRNERVVPAWAQFMSPSEYGSFLRDVTEAFRRIGSVIEVDEATGGLRVASGQEFGLVNLAQMYLEARKDLRAKVVEHHFRSLLTPSNAPSAEQMTDWEWVRPRLRVQLFAAGPFSADLGHAGAEVVVGDVVRLLAIDLPTRVETLNRDRVAALGVPLPELLATGLANVFEAEPWHQFPGEFSPGIPILAFSSESMFGASHALMLERHLPDPAPACLVGIPNQHLVLVHPIRDTSVTGAVLDMAATITGFHTKGPHSISKGLYLWRKGNFIDLPYTLIPGGTDFRPPAEFLDALVDLRTS